MNERQMVSWRDARGFTVARVTQGVQMKNGRPVAVYYAEVAGVGKEARDRYTCAVKAVNITLGQRGIAATPVMG